MQLPFRGWSRLMSWKALLVAVFSIGLAGLSGCLPIAKDVVTSYGTLRGSTDGKISAFLNVPYAQPPVGALRWKPTQPLQPWTGVREARRNGPACIQGGLPTDSFVTSEDCLTLDIWAPATPGPHPVMVWLHGGAFLFGAGNEPEYDGSALARERDVVVVAVNYRLSFMGFLALSQLGAESGNGRSGNQGYYDQLEALKWVKQEISKFGGDPGNVMLFGESAGAHSTCLMLASPLANGLFQRAAMESGNCRMLAPVAQAQADQVGVAFLTKLGCAAAAQPLECARAKTPQEILAALQIPPFEIFIRKSPADWAFMPSIVIDGNFLPDQPMTLLAAGAKPGVAVLLGQNKDEGSLFTELRDYEADAASYLTELQSTYGSKAPALAALYPHAAYPSTGAAMAAVFGDYFIGCPGRELADILSDAGHTVYAYNFVQSVSGVTDGMFNLMRGKNTTEIGSFHVSEIPFVFGKASILGNVDTAERKQTAEYMSSFWSGFAASGNPNGAGLPFWPAYTKAKPDYLELGNGFASKNAYRETYCQYWATQR